MKRISLFLLAAIAATSFAGCASSSPIGLVDVARLTANWDKYQSGQSQLASDEQALQTSKASNQQKNAQALQIQRKYVQLSDELAGEVRDAVAKVAAAKHLDLVVTRQGTGYGGVDVTPDVEKELGITEKATPTP